MCADLLALPNLWTLQQLEDLMQLSKQMRWSRGIEVILESKSCQRIFTSLSHTVQNIFCRRALKLPYEKLIYVTDTTNSSTPSSDDKAPLIYKNGKVLDDEDMDNGPDPQSNSKNKEKENEWGLDDHDRYELRRCIALSLATHPYASSFMLLDFVPEP